MKQEFINTGIKVPKPSAWNWTEKDRDERGKFILGMALILKLPEDWNKHVEFRSTDKFISLQERSNYKAIIFRRFLRGEEATIPFDLEETVNDYITICKDTQDKRNKEQEESSLFNELLIPVIDKFYNDEWRISTENNSLLIELKEKKNDNTYWSTKLAKCYIKRDGTITEPSFNFSFYNRSSITISELESTIKLYQSYYEPIMQKAIEIKRELPDQFFIKEKELA